MKDIISIVGLLILSVACSKTDDQPFRIQAGIYERTSLKMDGAEVNVGDSWQNLRINDIGVTETSDQGMLCDSENIYPGYDTPGCEPFVYTTFANKDSILFLYDSGKEERFAFKKKGKKITLSKEKFEALYERTSS